MDKMYRKMYRKIPNWRKSELEAGSGEVFPKGRSPRARQFLEERVLIYSVLESHVFVVLEILRKVKCLKGYSLVHNNVKIMNKIVLERGKIVEKERIRKK
jgi:hypothetical protein